MLARPRGSHRWTRENHRAAVLRELLAAEIERSLQRATSYRSSSEPALPAPEQARRASRQQAHVAVTGDVAVDNRTNARAITNTPAAVATPRLGRARVIQLHVEAGAPDHTAHSATASFRPTAFRIRIQIQIQIRSLQRTGRFIEVDQAVALPLEREQRRLRATHRQGIVAARDQERPAIGPTVERDTRGVNVEVLRENATVRPIEAMATPVVEHVRQRVPRVPGGADLCRVIAILEDLAAATVSVDLTREANREALHAARERDAIGRFDQQVKVRVLDRDVADTKVLTTEHAAQRATHVIVIGARAPRESTGATQDDVHRMQSFERRALAMRSITATARLLAPCPRAPAAATLDALAVLAIANANANANANAISGFLFDPTHILIRAYLLSDGKRYWRDALTSELACSEIRKAEGRKLAVAL